MYGLYRVHEILASYMNIISATKNFDHNLTIKPRFVMLFQIYRNKIECVIFSDWLVNVRNFDLQESTFCYLALVTKFSPLCYQIFSRRLHFLFC